VNLPLSKRETYVLQKYAWGYTNKEIAAGLGISVKTVEAHKTNGMRKLQLTARSELVTYAVQTGWLSVHASAGSTAPGSHHTAMTSVR
jgi:DNA-binding NarL/FixJ family response regulator